MGEPEISLPPSLRWIGTLCNATYFQPCPRHDPGPGAKEKGELTNFFARESGETLCPTCVGNADVVQIRRSSYHNVVRVRDVCRLFDARYIQTYVINGARVVFLNERPHPRGGKGLRGNESNAANHTVGKVLGGGRRSACTFCHRTLQSDTSLFCSIACKAQAGAELAPSEDATKELEAEEGSQYKNQNSKKTSAKKESKQSFPVGEPRTPAAFGGRGDGRLCSLLASGSDAAGREGGGYGLLSFTGATPESVSQDDDASPSGSGEYSNGRSIPHKRKRKRKEKVAASPLGFPELGGDGFDPSIYVGDRREVSLKKKEKKEKETVKVEKPPPAVISNSRRKNKPKKSPDA